MSDLALLLLVAAIVFASVAWGVYGVQRRRELERYVREQRAIRGPIPPALPRAGDPGRQPGNLALPPPAPSLEASAAPAKGEALEADARTSEGRLASDAAEGADRLAAGASNDRGAPAPRASDRDAASAIETAARAATHASEIETAAKPPTSASAIETAARAATHASEIETAARSASASASEVKAAAGAASAAASAAGATPEASVVSIEPGSPGDTAVVAGKPETDADRAPAVVLVHGILGFDHLKFLRWRVHYFRGVADHLRRVGVNAYVVRVPALDAVPARALALAEFVKALPHRRVTLVAHSMGGLDARYAITRLGLAERVPVLVTVATPHRGTPLADLLARRPAKLARRLAAKFGARSEAIECLTTERMARFNEEVPDAPGVTYACVPCGRRARPGAIHPLLRPTHAYLRRVAGPNDGLVPVSSQLWGAVVEEIEADHWAQVGWSRRFDAPLFYADVVVHLSRLGLLPAPSFHELPPARAPLRFGPAPAPASVLARPNLEPRPNELRPADLPAWASSPALPSYARQTCPPGPRAPHRRVTPGKPARPGLEPRTDELRLADVPAIGNARSPPRAFRFNYEIAQGRPQAPPPAPPHATFARGARRPTRRVIKANMPQGAKLLFHHRPSKLALGAALSP